MKVSVFGLGYVGTVSAGCLAERGHNIIGVDLSSAKVEMINKGESPVIEAGLEELIATAVRENRLVATIQPQTAILATDISIICVGTPSQKNGGLDVTHLQNVCTQIGGTLKEKETFHVVVIRSTILPGTMRKLVIPLLERMSGKKAGIDFGVCNNPEFLREGTAVADFLNPAKTVIGETDKKSGDIVESLYAGLPGPVIRCAVEVGEMVKYADNAWHATKVTFANEIGALCKSLAIDSHAVMDIFCQDTKLNLSPYYLKPGFAFGGSCLPKDLRALNHLARSVDTPMSLLGSILPSNEAQIDAGLQMILSTGKKSVGFLGFSFKAGTDDLRESPLVEVIERLIGKGFELRLYDKNVSLARLTGANRDYILRVIPHIERLMVDSMDKVLIGSDVIVIGNNALEFADIAARLRPEQVVIDFVRIKPLEAAHENYHGICW